MTPDELKRQFPNASAGFIAANCGTIPGAVLKPTFRYVPLGPASGEGKNQTRFRVCIVSFRTKLTDPDNLCGKYFLDCCRRARIIADDSARFIDYSIRQERVKTKREERTEILITAL